jgi:hypothetical protein
MGFNRGLLGIFAKFRGGLTGLAPGGDLLICFDEIYAAEELQKARASDAVVDAHATLLTLQQTGVAHQSKMF